MAAGADYLDFLKGQRQTREFTSEPVSDADIQALLETMRWTGSSSNSQPWQFIVVRDQAAKDALAQATQYTGWIANAPLILVVSPVPPGPLPAAATPSSTIEVPAPNRTITRVTVPVSTSKLVLWPVNPSVIVCLPADVTGIFWIDSTPSRPSFNPESAVPSDNESSMVASPAKQLEPPRSSADACSPGARAMMVVPLPLRQ
jgi:hypothetical protein